MYHRYRHTLFLLALLLSACARQGFPEGGPRDTEPPRIVEETPPNGSLHFAAGSFFVGFDEYVNLQDADNNVIISPPMSPKPTFATRRRGVQVTFNDSLRPNTTYLFQFKNAVADLNEGNKLGSYEYAFSTGGVIDSMMLQGSVLDAFSHEPRKDAVTVMLYADSLPDSAVVSGSPSHVTRCDADGSFRFSNIKPGSFRLVAIEDADRNFRYSPNEAVAFASDVVNSYGAKDTLRVLHNMLMSIDEGTVQRVASSSMSRESYAEIVTVAPMFQPSVQCDTACVWRLSPNRDTIRLWTMDPHVTSLVVTIADSGLSDTIKMQYRKRRRGAGNAMSSQSDAWCRFSFSGSLPYFATPKVMLSMPIDTSASHLDSAVVVMHLPDSVVSYHNLVVDSGGMGASFSFDVVAEHKYVVKLRAAVLRNLYGEENDSLQTAVEAMGAEKYGAIIVTLADADPSMRYLVQITDEQGAVKATMPVSGAAKARFANLQPSSYKVQVIVDNDGNGKWTPGNYFTKRQPEAVLYLGKTLVLRANWDIEETISVAEGGSASK